MPELIPVLKKNDIEKMVADAGQIISSDYRGCELIIIGVLKGAFIFTSDLIRHITVPLKVDFIRVSSYGCETASSENIKLAKKIETDIKNKDVLIVEDIVDTGLSLAYIINYLKSFGPKTLKVCALLDKWERRKANVRADYACHAVEKGFLVGYGLDYAEHYRNLPDIYQLNL
ncbi:MAG: hypoxanthine phosphoribosyltransferase [Desulfobacterales bacterium]|nr:hypoxanthine phosphoribosyltransferase [Desulfobacterales bacterium]